MINTGENNFLFQLISLMLLEYILYYLLRLNSIVPYINLFIDLLISYLFRIFLNDANKCSHASRDMGLTII
jgi:hypothetical protein